MIPESKVGSFYLEGNYDLNDNVSVFGELLHSQRKTKSRNVRQLFSQDGGGNGGYLPVTAIPGWAGTASVLPVAISNHFSNDTTIDYTRGVVGFEAELGEWLMNFSYQRTFNNGTYRSDIFLRDAVHKSQRVLRGEACDGVTPLSQRPCYAVEWFDKDFLNGNPSQGARDFLFGEETGNTYYKQDTLDVYVTGDLFELPAGMVGTAYGLSYQTDFIKDTPGAETLRGNSHG
ncbi:hypothetical protein [Alishewanella longhuensis]